MQVRGAVLGVSGSGLQVRGAGLGVWWFGVWGSYYEYGVSQIKVSGSGFWGWGFRFCVGVSHLGFNVFRFEVWGLDLGVVG